MPWFLRRHYFVSFVVPAFSYSFIRISIECRIILDLISAEVASQVQSSQDSLVVHGKSLIENTLHS
jgi:hypothetical protein